MIRIATAILLGTGLVAATALTAAEDPIANRKGIMKNVGASMGVLGKMAKGEMEFEPTAAHLALRVMNAGSYGYGELFPAGSETGGETEASPKIWESMDDFQAKVAKFQADTAAAVATPPASKEDLGATLGSVGANCKECHEAFRIKKN